MKIDWANLFYRILTFCHITTWYCIWSIYILNKVDQKCKLLWIINEDWYYLLVLFEC